MEGFSDSDWGTKYGGRSFSGYGINRGGFICWESKKQPISALSSTESELRSMSELLQELLWLETLVTDFKITMPIELWYDNQGAISLCKNPFYHHCTCHINIRMNWIQDILKNKKILVNYIATHDMWADILTHGLGRLKLEKFCK
ncbi:hypothetical protein O181_038809 [Austropuccinia psidii MF-1]|uniref:Copia protein n=1 Tax=Austropuccinia psidii MF-1 TaxID=1389203 RepID=A0A9Q3D961_9BASI|nr:hypothetical protein [Austropuccinia psidii MF-1]